MTGEALFVDGVSPQQFSRCTHYELAQFDVSLPGSVGAYADNGIVADVGLCAVDM